MNNTNDKQTAKARSGSLQRMVRRQYPTTVNNGFWDRPAEERAARMDAACERGGVSNFSDLSPEERGRAYDA